GIVQNVVLAICLVDHPSQLEDARSRVVDLAHTLTIGARLTARIFIPTLSNLTMTSSSVRVIVLFSTAPRPQERCSTWSPGLYRWTSSTAAAGRAASMARAGAMVGSGIPDGMPAEPSTSSLGISARNREGTLRLAFPHRGRGKGGNRKD